jgi:hypothetical protein
MKKLKNCDKIKNRKIKIFEKVAQNLQIFLSFLGVLMTDGKLR